MKEALMVNPKDNDPQDLIKSDGMKELEIASVLKYEIGYLPATAMLATECSESTEGDITSLSKNHPLTRGG
jgi:hypothetical protein